MASTNTFEIPQPTTGSWWNRAILISTGVLLAAAAAVIFLVLQWRRPPTERLTHIVKRGDMLVTVAEKGLLESSNNKEIKCKVRGKNAVLWVVKSGNIVNKGDKLVVLDSLFIQEQVEEREKYKHWSRSSAERSDANVKRTKLELEEYAKGSYISERITLWSVGLSLFIAIVVGLVFGLYPARKAAMMDPIEALRRD